MYDSVFRRVEEKYLLTEKQQSLLFKKISSYLNKDPYYESKICSIYFDTDNYDLIIKSLEKPLFKEKIRLRSYGVPKLQEDVFLELKTKYRGVVGKRRIKIKLKDFYDYLENKKPMPDEQVMKEIDYYFSLYHLTPKVFVAYDRKSYIGKEDNGLRITLDANLRSRHEDLRLELGDAGNKYFKENYVIMEIKTLGAMPLWLVRSLSELKIYPTSFSKYGSIYEQEMKKEDCVC